MRLRSRRIRLGRRLDPKEHAEYIRSQIREVESRIAVYENLGRALSDYLSMSERRELKYAVDELAELKRSAKKPKGGKK